MASSQLQADRATQTLPPQTRRLPSLRVGVPVLVALSSAVIAWIRIPSLARGTFWAEDGRTFVQAAIDSGPFAPLFQPYAGYLHLIPRLLASLTVEFTPASDWAIAMTASSCLVAGVAAGVVFVCSAEVVRWMPARLVLALLTVITPLASREVLGNAANLHSLLMWMAFWILLARPRRRSSSIMLSVLLILAALTEIQTVFLLPLLVFRWRERARWMPRLAFVAGVCAQLLVTLLAPRPVATAQAVDPGSVAYGYLINAVLPSWIPTNRIGIVLVTSGPWLGLVLLAVCVAAAVLAFAWGAGPQRWAAAAMLILSVVIWVSSVTIDPASFYEYARLSPAGLLHPWLSRYGVVPGMLLLAELMLAASAIRARVDGSRRAAVRRVIPGVLLLAVLFSALSLGAAGYTRRSAGPSWKPQVIAAAESCEHVRDASRVSLRETLHWRVSVPCALLIGGRPPTSGH